VSAKKYRSRPKIVEAIRWTGDNNVEVLDWTGIHTAKDMAGYEDGTELLVFVPLAYPEALLFVAANHAYVPIEPGEWVVRDVLGFYPCKNEVFIASYEELKLEYR
jgi:hypothetical protein